MPSYKKKRTLSSGFYFSQASLSTKISRRTKLTKYSISLEKKKKAQNQHDDPAKNNLYNERERIEETTPG